jgi:hypothetical protein
MSTVKLDILHAHSDDISQPMEGHFGNIYHTWDQAAARRREVDDRQRIVAANRLSTQEAESGK